MSKIAEALIKKFQTHRVIFWYDERQEFTEQFEMLELEGIDKVHVQGNEFEIKHLIVKKAPERKFLLYFTGPKPANEENWLLDQELAHYVFHTDQEAMFLQEAGLGFHLKELVGEHIEFFKAKERLQKLKELVNAEDEHRQIRYKMLAVTFGTEHISLPVFIQIHGSAFAHGANHFDKELDRFNLSTFYWKEIGVKYNYHSDHPSIYDFLLDTFNTNWVLSKKTELSRESRLLLSSWKDHVQHRVGFRKISEKIASDLDVENRLNGASPEDIVTDDLFRLTDFKIIHDLVSLISEESISFEKVNRLIKQREYKFWYDDFAPIYAGISKAAELIALIRQHGDVSLKSFSEASGLYANKLFRIDMVYREFIYQYRKAAQNRILTQLADKAEKIYINDWLMTFNNKWQKHIDQLEQWPAKEEKSQQLFFKNNVTPFLKKNQRVFVIISDAFRYESGIELMRRLQGINRFEASGDYMISTLPSYTQLGMAAMLPHRELSLKEGSDEVLADGIPATGVNGRTKILAQNSGVNATAINAEEFMGMNTSTEGRDFAKKHNVMYIYHNRIDKTGDDKTSEDKVFEAVEEEIQFIIELIRKIANVNGTNILVTSDHGFLYQQSPLAESDFSEANQQGEILKVNRRFVMGKNLSGNSATKAFSSSSLNLHSDLDFLFPKSVNRLRVKGAGSRFIHGGTSLQEIIIPLIKITKKKQDTVSQVGIDIIKSTDRITTNILAVSFVQSDLVSEQVLPRTIRAGIYADDG